MEICVLCGCEMFETEYDFMPGHKGIKCPCCGDGPCECARERDREEREFLALEGEFFGKKEAK